MCKVQNNTSVSKCTDRGSGGAESLSHVIAQPQLTESSLHQAAAAQSKIYELGSLFLTNWSESVASERGQRKQRKITLTRRPGAYLAGMARQCPRGRPGAVDQARPRGDFTWMHREHHTWSFHRRAHMRSASTWASSACSASSSDEAPHRSDRRRQIPSGESKPISSEGKRLAIPFGGAGRGRVGEHFALGGGSGTRRSRPELPDDGGGDLRSPEREKVKGERWGAEAGLGRFDRPRTWPVGLDQPGWLGQANRPKPIYKTKSVFKFEILFSFLN
jgi:hypothetical protein